MIRIAIVEDEESYIATLNEYLNKYQEEYSEQSFTTETRSLPDIRLSSISS